jgi:hypothetical protein
VKDLFKTEKLITSLWLVVLGILTGCNSSSVPGKIEDRSKTVERPSIISIVNAQQAKDSALNTELVEKLDSKLIGLPQEQMLKVGGGEIIYTAVCGGEPSIELTIAPSIVTISEEQIARLTPYKRKAAWEQLIAQQKQDKQQVNASKLDIARFNRQVEASVAKTGRNCSPGDLLKAYNRASTSLVQQRSQWIVPPNKYLVIVSNQLSFYKYLAKVRCPEGVQCGIIAASRPQELDPKIKVYGSVSSAMKSIVSEIAKN